MDERDLFREITLRICGTLDIEDGLKRCFKLLEQHIPIDSLYLERFERDLNAIRVIVHITQDSSERIDVLIPIPDQGEELMNDVMGEVDAQTIEPVLMFNRSDDIPMVKEMLQLLGEPPSSAMSMPLYIEDRHLGALDLFVNGQDKFDEKHKELLASLKEPFSMAMSNMLEHREVVQLKNRLAEDNQYLHHELRRLSGDEIVGSRFGLRDVMEKARQVAPLVSPVLLLGETGAGKDVIANAIHYSSPRSEAPFIKVNCGAIPDTLIDSELFGHEKGSFTGAANQKRGCFERAHKGTVFLDEIGELPLQAQVRLLRVLQDKEVTRVGGDKTIKLDIRIIVATNRNLDEMVREGRFREDLWFRLNVFPIWLPPLRQRKSDIPELVQFFIEKKSAELKLPSIPKVATKGLEALSNYDWPGNVRELANIVERELILNPLGPIKFSGIASAQPTSTTDHSKTNILKLDEMIAEHIKLALRETGGQIHGKGGAAEILGINASTLRSRMKKLGIK